ncbi:MAG: response regulator [Phormidesmis sp.]
MRVLLVDDDNALTSLLAQQLTVQNHAVDRVADGETGWAYASTFDYDLIVLDWMLPQLDGIRLCQRLRQEGYGVPILLLTARDEQTDKIKGLEAGADDYVVKPFDIAELMARMRVLLRRSQADAAPVLSWGDLCLDPVSCQVTYQGKPVALTAKEYSLLELFLRHAQQVFSATTLLARIWPSEEFPSEATVRSHIRGLRQKLKAVGAAADLIETVHGLGYRLKAPVPDMARAGERTAATQRDRQSRFLDGLTQAWKAHKGESIERWQTLVKIAQTLEETGHLSGLSEQQRVQAQQMAHSLAGTLGTFGLMQGYRLALEVEQCLLQFGPALSASQIAQFQTLITTLGHALDDSPKLVCPIEERVRSPKVLIVDVNNTPAIQQLMALAIAQGIETSVAASIETASETLSLGTAFQPFPELIAPIENPPDLIIVNLVASEMVSALDESILKRLLQFIEQLTQRWPQLPTVVITPQADFGNRLNLIRRGGAIVLEYPVVPADVLDVITRAINLSYRLSKIMIVDDDAHYLKQVIQLLHPWDFQITPLSNPQRFWSLFNQVSPDLIILDIEMPHINGFELCQVLRSHAQWQHLPIVFLSVHTDPTKQAQAFALGADDYITKPIQGKDLASRLLNRLKRYQAKLRWQQAAEA